MGYFDWKDSLSIGVQAMDSQHQELIGLMNRLYKQSEERESKEHLIATLGALDRFTRKHFAEEEVFMASIGYTQLATHKIIHTQLLQTLGEHMALFIKSTSKQIPSGLFTFLKLWLTSHILGIDMRYAEFVNKGAA